MTPGELDKKIMRAKIALLLEHPLFGMLLAEKLETVPDERFETACVDGKKIYYNSKFFTEITDAELRGVLAHEVMHVAFGHLWRKQSRDLKAWNVATDKEINGILRQAGLSLPTGCYYPSQAEEGRACEALYVAPKDTQDGASGAGGGKGGKGTPDEQKPGIDPGRCGGMTEKPAENDVTKGEDLQAEWNVALSNAWNVLKGQGCAPGYIEKQITEIIDPAVPWRRVLQEFVARNARSDYSWTRTNTRYAGRGVCLPTLVSDTLPPIFVVRYTSGSIDQKQAAEFLAEVTSLLETYETTITLLDADTRVAQVVEITREDLPVNIPTRGGGGTDFRPAFDYVEKEGIEPACVIYFTDLMGAFPKDEPPYPVLWAYSGAGNLGGNLPFGTLITL